MSLLTLLKIFFQFLIFLIYRLGRLICAVGHDGTVDAVAMMKSSVHKRLCISGARDRALIIWDVDSIIVRIFYSFFASLPTGFYENRIIYSFESTVSANFLFHDIWL